MIEKSISYRSSIYYFYFYFLLNSYGRMLNHGGLVQILFKEFALDHDSVSACQDKISIHIFIHDLPHLLLTNVKILCSFSQGYRTAIRCVSGKYAYPNRTQVRPVFYTMEENYGL